jgi:hypothetical protein
MTSSTAGGTAALSSALVEVVDRAAEPIARLPMPSPPPPPAPSASAQEPVRGAVEVVADAPVVQLHLGTRSVALPDPRARFEVTLTREERARDIEITLVAVDRRRVTVAVKPDQELVRVQFPRFGARPRPTSKKSGPDIVADPYGAP